MGEVFARWQGMRNAPARALSVFLRRAALWYRWRWLMVAAIGLLFYGLAVLYQQTDGALAEPMELLAEEVVPSPVVLEDLMAPLAPGLSPSLSMRLPICLRIVEYGNESQSPLANLARPPVFEELAAPLPPGLNDVSSSACRKGVPPQLGATPKESAWKWKASVLQTY
jgi:hypothetical protein